MPGRNAKLLRQAQRIRRLTNNQRLKAGLNDAVARRRSGLARSKTRVAFGGFTVAISIWNARPAAVQAQNRTVSYEPVFARIGTGQ